MVSRETLYVDESKLDSRSALDGKSSVVRGTEAGVHRDLHFTVAARGFRGYRCCHRPKYASRLGFPFSGLDALTFLMKGTLLGGTELGSDSKVSSRSDSSDVDDPESS